MQQPLQFFFSYEEGLRGLAQVSRLVTLSQEDANTLMLWIHRDPSGAQLLKHCGIDVVQCAGRIEMREAGQFQEVLVNASEGSTRIAVDLTNVETLSSTALRVLMLFAKAARARSARTVLIVPPNGLIREILTIARFGTVFPIVATRDEAIAFLEGPPK